MQSLSKSKNDDEESQYCLEKWGMYLDKEMEGKRGSTWVGVKERVEANSKMEWKKMCI